MTLSGSSKTSQSVVSPSANQYYTMPLVMQNLYNQLVSGKEDCLPFGKQRNGGPHIPPNNGASKNDNSLQLPNCGNQQQQSCDNNVRTFPSCPQNIPTFNFEFDDDLDAFLPKYGNKLTDTNMNYCENLLGNHDQNAKNMNQPTNLANMLHCSGGNSDVHMVKAGIRKGRNKSDSDFCKSNNKRNKGTVKKGSRKSPYDCGNKTTKSKVANSSENKNSSDVSSTSSTSTTTISVSSPVPEKLAAIKKLYYENKLNYRFHQYLRQLTSDNGKDENEPYPLKKLQNCGKVFLKQLSTPIMDSWIFDSVAPGVENEKDIDLKNMTKRKITIYEDIPTDTVSI